MQILDLQSSLTSNNLYVHYKIEIKYASNIIRRRPAKSHLMFRELEISNFFIF